MRKYFLAIILSIIISSPMCRAQGNKTHTGLTDYDKKHYILTVDQKQVVLIAKISPPFDTKKYLYAATKAILTNNSNDTLKYVNMTCGWDEAFTTNNKNIRIYGWGCDSNFPTVYKIPPYKSPRFDIPFLIAKNLAGKRFRIGLYLIKAKEGHSMIGDFEAFRHLKKDFADCLIWSNEVTIPKP
jgi:hypothetical protein